MFGIKVGMLGMLPSALYYLFRDNIEIRKQKINATKTIKLV